MFFRLTNSPVTFQTIMNDILRDFINHIGSYEIIEKIGEAAFKLKLPG
jgi:hypothetical protein